MPLDQAFVGRSYPPTAPYLVSREKIAEFATRSATRTRRTGPSTRLASSGTRTWWRRPPSPSS